VKKLRPIRRGNSPIENEIYPTYQKAKEDLIDRFASGWNNGRHIASYCSYCERKIETNLAVEHIKPKDGEFGHPELELTWSNFLLACVNCNSTKGAKEVIFHNLFLPDRDNTFYAFEYTADGMIKPRDTLSSTNKARANITLKLLGLDKATRETYSATGNLIALDRGSQRIEIWGLAEEALCNYLDNIENQSVKKLIVINMLSNGFFSIWMTVFDDYSEMKNLFIDAIHGTRKSGCFNDEGNSVISHSNEDQLAGGGKPWDTSSFLKNVRDFDIY